MMPKEAFRPLRFDPILYPLWRRRWPAALMPLLIPLFEQIYPVDYDRDPNPGAAAMARYLHEWGILPGEGPQNIAQSLMTSDAHIVHVDTDRVAPAHDGSPLSIPAQWDQTEAVLISWGILYPWIWPMHASMAEAISQVARVEILLPSEMWARAVWTYLAWRGKADMSQIELLIIPTNDVWIRDYGPIMGRSKDGQRVALNPTYAVLPDYPQGLDDGMTLRWAAHHNIAVQPFDLFTEGGNMWSDGQGTLIMSEQIFYSNRYYDRESLLAFLHERISFDKAIITPRLTLEETGHVDLLVKLASADTVFVSAATSLTTAQALRKTRRLFQREHNAQGQPYQVIELPTPALYLNWFTYTIRRAYTNSLTVNGQVLVPTFGLPEDEIALRTYEAHMPGYRIIPIDSAIGINGGGAVHCMTKEIPFS